VIKEFGVERVALVLAETIQRKCDDGRFSRRNKEWAAQTEITPDESPIGHDYNWDFVVGSHPALVDGFTNQFRKIVQEFENFNQVQNNQTMNINL
jgi:hypothetical protein